MHQRKMSLEELIKWAGDCEVSGPIHKTISHITNDSRKVKEATLFVAIEGVHFDGSEFIEEAIRRGATVIVSERKVDLPKEITGLWVQDARNALADLSSAFYGWPARQLMMIGVTGTNGKTSVCYFLQAILKASGRQTARLGTTGHDLGRRVLPARMTTPESVELQEILAELLTSGHDSVVMEASSHALSQDRVRGIDFRAGIFTNLSQDHLDYHQDLGEYLEAKRKLFTQLGPGAIAVLNRDEEASESLAKNLQCPVAWYGMRSSSGVTVSEVDGSLWGSEFRLITPQGQKKMALHVAADFTLLNFLAAATAALALGCTVEHVAEGAAHVTQIPGRAETVEAGGRRVMVDYAHTPAALEALLSWARKYARGKLVIVFGAGGDRDRAKRPLMGGVASRIADRVIITSDNPRTEDPQSIVNDILSGVTPADRSKVEVVLDRREAIHHAVQTTREEDAVLIAGKGHERMQIFHRQEIPFDDREIAREILLHDSKNRS